MDIAMIIQWAGWGGLTLFCLLGLVIVFNNTLFILSGKTFIVWVSVFFFYTLTVRIIRAFGIFTLQDAQTITSIVSFAPLIGVIAHMIVATRRRKTPPPTML